MFIAISLHVLAAAIWVGGMFFAYIALRPVAAELLQPPERLKLWCGVFKRFFPWVWMAVLILLLSGFWAVFFYFGELSVIGIHIYLMMVLGILMIIIFFHVYYGPYRQLQIAISNEDWPTGATKLNRIRLLIKTNLILGLIVIITATAGHYL